MGRSTVRDSKILDIQFKTGSSGPLCFVTVEHTYSQAGLASLIELQTIVYRDQPDNKSDTKIANAVSTQHDNHLPCFNSKVLFRYSALTFNSHRIHYDRDYAINQEGYCGLVVHGPLMATLLIQHANGHFPHKEPDEFCFRVVSPLYENEGYQIKTKNDEHSLDMMLVKYDGTHVISAKLKWRD